MEGGARRKCKGRARHVSGVKLVIGMPAISQNPYRRLTLAQLQQMQTDWLACHTAIAVGNQSYMINNRQFTRADLEQVSKVIGDIGEAIEHKSGRAVTVAQARNW